MSDSRIGAQLYTLREFTKTPADIAETMKKVREIGYEAVQVSGMGPIDPKELKKIVDGEGLVNLVLQHYEQFDSKYKGMMPLKRAYVPEPLEEGD